MVVIGNFTPVPRKSYRIGVPRRCAYREVLNTDAKEYGGSGMGNFGLVPVEEVASHGFDQSIVITLPPLGVLWFVPSVADEEEPAEVVPAPALDAVTATGAVGSKSR